MERSIEAQSRYDVISKSATEGGRETDTEEEISDSSSRHRRLGGLDRNKRREGAGLMEKDREREALIKIAIIDSNLH